MTKKNKISDYLDEHIKELRKRLEIAAKQTISEKRVIGVVEVITLALAQYQIYPVLVGGAAVEFYTSGRYATGDLDFVCPSSPDLSRVMERLGFTRYGKNWVDERLKLYIEFPSSSLAEGETYDLIKGDDCEIRIISVEDLIVDRLSAFKFWKSLADARNVILLLEICEYDEKLLNQKAKKADLLDTLKTINQIFMETKRGPLSSSQVVDKLKKILSNSS